jgi:hypothetical protein
VILGSAPNVLAFHVAARGIHDGFTIGPQIHPRRSNAVLSRYSLEDTMADKNEQVRITLTPEQRAMVKTATGKDASSLELSVQELEERIAPGGLGQR